MKGWVIMKKALKKIAVMVTIVALTMGNSVLSAAESGFSTQFEVSDPNEVYRWIYNHLSHISLNDADKQKIIEEYLDSSEFLYQFQHDKEAALDNIITRLEIDDRLIKEQNQGLSRGVSSSGNLYSCSVNTKIVQEKDTWCGVASTLMVLTGIYSHDSYSLISTYKEPSQTAISKKVIPSGETTAFVYAIVDYLNSQLKSSASNKYAYTFVGSTMTTTKLTNYIKSSLAAYRPVILRAAPYGTLSYYNGSGISRSTLHYIVIDGYDKITDTFWVADCTYLKAYQGRHYNVAASEIKSCVEGSYIIHA